MNIIKIVDKYLEENNVDESVSRYFDPKIWGRKILGVISDPLDPVTFKRYKDVLSTKKIIADVKDRIKRLPLIDGHIHQDDLREIYNDLVKAEIKFSDKELKQLKDMFRKAEKGQSL